MITGTINRIEDHGTIVVVFIDSTPVYFDHTPFRWLIEAEGDLVGRTANYDGEQVELDVEVA